MKVDGACSCGAIKVEAEADPEILMPLARAEQISARYGQKHDHDERDERRERPSRVRDGLRWGCH